jgi:acetyl esterase
MPLDPQARQVLDALDALGTFDYRNTGHVELRALSNARGPDPGVPLAGVEDRAIDGVVGEIPVRIYTPEGDPPFPALVYFHGGGFVICGLESHDSTCRQLCYEARCVVISVDYRLAPEHRFPAAVEDCHAAASWVAARASEIGVDPSRIAVGGDSAGGNLAATVALMARDRGGPALVHQLLVYPCLDPACDTASHREIEEGYLLDRAMMQWFWGHYLASDEEARSPYASPIRAASLGGLPPAHLVTAEFDPLRDEGVAYAEKLRADGVAVTHAHYDGMIHGFLSMFDAIDVGKRAVSDAAAALTAAFAR